MALILCLVMAMVPASGYAADRSDLLDKKFKNGTYLVSTYQSGDQTYTTDLDTIPYDKLDYIIYAFAEPYTDGTLRPLKDPDYLKQLVEKAHAAGTKVFLGVGGGISAMDLETIAADEHCTLRFIKVLKEAIKTYDLDGIDIDWESPLSTGDSPQNCEKLMTRLASELKPMGVYFTAAVAGAFKPNEGNYNTNGWTNKCVEQFDWLHVMTYDMYEVNSPLYFSEYSLQYWHNVKKVPKDKLLVGVPFCGKPTWRAYKDLVAENPNNAYLNQVVGEGEGNICNYDGINAIREKTKLSLENGGGMFSWAIDWDAPGEYSLTALMDKTIKEAQAMGVSAFINKATVVYNDREIAYDWDSGFPYIDGNNRTMVPFRKSVETLGMTVDYDAINKIATASGNGITIQIPINQKYIIVNGTTVEIDTQAVIYADRTYIPMRACFEAAGAKIKEWHNSTRTAYVVK